MATTQTPAAPLAAATPVTPPVTPVAPATEPITPANATPQRVTSAFFKNWGKEEKPAAPPTAAPAAVVPEKPKPDPKPAKPKPAPVAQEEGFDPNLPTPPKVARATPDEIRTIVQEAVKGAVAGARKEEAPVPKEELPKNITRKIELLDVLEKDNPAYKGTKEKVQSFYRKGGAEDAYKAEWLRENPKKKFNREDEEHDEFYAANDPLVQVQEDDWDEARDKLVTQRAREIAQETTRKAMNERRTEEAQGHAAQNAKSTLDGIALEAIAGLSPELAEKAKTPEKLRTLDKDDPIAEHVLIQSVNRYAPAVEGTLEIFNGVPYDQKNSSHRMVSDLGVELEDRIAALPENNSRRGSQRFATIQQMQQMPATERGKFWSIGQNDILNFIKIRVKSESQGLYERLKGGKVVSKADQSSENGNPANGDIAVETVASGGSPSIGASPSAPPPGQAGSISNGSNTRSFFSQWKG